MANRGLTFKEFCKLPYEERAQRYSELSDHDKFLARCSELTDAKHLFKIPCNSCIHRIKRTLKCEAYPDGIDADHIRAVMEDIKTECGNGYFFQETTTE